MDHECTYCGDRSGPFHLDHVVPRSRGGIDHPMNIVVACQNCNASKRDRLASEWRTQLPEHVLEIERRVSAIVARRVRRRGAVETRPAPRLACEVCGRDLFANWNNAHLGWWRRYNTSPEQIVGVALYCTGACYRVIDRRHAEQFGEPISLSDLRVEAFFGRWAWLELASMVEDAEWPRDLLQKVIGILRQTSKIEPEYDPPFAAEEGDDPTMVDD